MEERPTPDPESPDSETPDSEAPDSETLQSQAIAAGTADPGPVAPGSADPEGSTSPDGRITEVGAPEQIDRLEHPVAVAVGMAVLVVLLFLGVVALGSSLSDDDRRTEIVQVVVPSMAGRSLVDAQAELERLGLIVDVLYDSNELVPVDVVIDHEPIAGSRIEVGEQVRLRVSDGPAGIDVPDMAGLQGGEAVQLLQTIGLLATIENVNDETIRPGEVVGSSPASGHRAPPGSTVVVKVSQGPAPRTVPEIIGLSTGEAVVALGRADLTLGVVTPQYSPDQAPGLVLSSDPAPGAQAPRDQPVALVVTSPELPILVPDLVGLSRASAASVAEARGLTTSVRNQEVPAGDARIGRVVSQSPVAGSRVGGETNVQLTVGVLAVPTTTTVAPSTTAPAATTTTVGR